MITTKLIRIFLESKETNNCLRFIHVSPQSVKSFKTSNLPHLTTLLFVCLSVCQSQFLDTNIRQSSLHHMGSKLDLRYETEIFLPKPGIFRNQNSVLVSFPFSGFLVSILVPGFKVFGLPG